MRRETNTSRAQTSTVVLIAGLLTLSVVAGAVALAAGGTTVSITPADDSVDVGESTTFTVVVDNADGGVGAAEVGIAVDDPSVATIADVTVPGSGVETVNIAGDGSSADVEYAFRDTDDTGTVGIIEVTVEGQADGEVGLSLEAAEGNDGVLVFDEEGTGYDVTGTNGATLTVGTGPATPTPEPATPTETPTPEPATPTETPTPEPATPTPTPTPEPATPTPTPTPEPATPTPEPDPANFQVSNLQAPGSATQGDLIDASVVVENTGEQTATKTVEFRVDTNDDGSIADENAVRSQDVELAPGESKTFSFEDVDTSGLPIGTLTHGVATPDDSETAQITIEEPAPAEPAPETSLRLDPNSDTVQQGKTTSYKVVVDGADGGVGAAELAIVIEDPSMATITDATVLGSGEQEITIAEDGSRVDIEYAFRDTMDAGYFPIIEVTVEGASTGETALSIEATEGNDEVLLFNEEGTGYDVTGTTGATLSVKSGDGSEPTPEPEPEPPEETPDAFQIDLVEGEVLQQLDPDEGDTYHRQDRFITARHFTEDEKRWGTSEPSRTYQSNGCEVGYSRPSFEPDTGVSEVTVSVSDIDGCEEITISYAGYELPDGTTEYVPERADEQELKDSVTVTLEPGDEVILSVDVIDENDSE